MSTKRSFWTTGRDAEISVNHRALIDKVLARYAAENTVLRELLQNADDAQASNVEIHYKTRAFLDNGTVTSADSASQLSEVPDLTKELLHQWELRNDGIIFREEDWRRLQKIAEGNPDEQNIGAFGVGFYALFSVTEEPFVTSGNQWMGFYWKDGKDQLFARRGIFPPKASESSTNTESKFWTSFTMPLREPSTFPGRPVDIARFLAMSLTFVRNLRSVSVFFNQHRIFRVTKTIGHPTNLPLLASLNPKTSTTNMMTVTAVEALDIRIRVDMLRWANGTGNGPAPPAHLDLKSYSAKVETHLAAKMTRELERAMRKKPPTVCWYSLIYTGKDEYDDSREEDGLNIMATNSVFQGLRADLEGAGTAKVFIGHATSQSAGIGGHISARFIPTVERESIDFVDRHVSVWNKELLKVGGYLCRFIYESQLAIITTESKRALQAAGTSDEVMGEVMERWYEASALHALQFFTFHPTTPSPIVGLDMEAAFFACQRDARNFPIISTAGVHPASAVRTWSPEVRSFLKTIPMVPESVAKNAQAMLATLKKNRIIQDVSFGDVLEGLERGPLTEEHMVKCLQWKIGLDTANFTLGYGHERQFLDAAFVAIRETKEGTDPTAEKIVPLSSVKTFLGNSNAISPNFPLPSHTLPFSLSKHFKPNDLHLHFGWGDLSIPDWLVFLVAPETLSSLPSESQITTSPVFAERILNIVAKAWVSLPRRQSARVIEILQAETVIPTNGGMKKPEEVYFANVNVFPDLPIVDMPKGGPVKDRLERLLVSLGVMRRVDLQIVFSKMITTQNWGIQELMKYLSALQTALSPTELSTLGQIAAFPQEPTSGSISATSIRKTPSQLYEPTDALRVLGLPLLDWSNRHKWRPHSDEAKLLFNLGLRRFPALDTVIVLAAGPNSEIRRKALAYFLDNFDRYAPTYRPEDYAEVAFVPAVNSDGTAFLAKPHETFCDPKCAILGVALVEPSLRSDAIIKLKLPKDPPAVIMVSIVTQRPPSDPETAQQWFEYLMDRIDDFTPQQFMLFQTSPIVPTSSLLTSDAMPITQADHIVMSRPGECFFRSAPPETSNSVHLKLFTFVDFGDKANNFLRACGAKNDPSIQDIANLLVYDPKHFLEVTGGPLNYLGELHQIAAYYTFPPELSMKMKETPFLIGSCGVPKSADARAVIDPREEDDIIFSLLRPDQIVIVDDTDAYSLFCDSLYGAPQEEVFEAFYQSLGSKRISSLITEDNYPELIKMAELSAGVWRSSSALSEQGARGNVPSIRQIWSWTPEVRSFLPSIPMVPESVAENAPAMLGALKVKGIIRDVQFSDVLEELGQRALTEEQMVECLKWKISLNTVNTDVGHDREQRKQFLHAALVSVQEQDTMEEKIVPLSNVKTFLSNFNIITPDLPVPSHTLPFALGKHFKPNDLHLHFGWTDLSIPDWLEFLVAPDTLSTLPPESQITNSPAFAKRILSVVADAWIKLPKGQTTRVIDILQAKAVIPTRLGMTHPKNAYFGSAKVFPDLPIIEIPEGGPVTGNLQRLAAALGVAVVDRSLPSETKTLSPLVNHWAR